ncbi:MAG: hypothetical protein KatS3mg131_1534 [Candidatus Tectimicrobiota bacterium]|nr:MAG: hypothetical protein KatS3mg131_1534 [Candidatus Tectomicrobia bacterium]
MAGRPTAPPSGLPWGVGLSYDRPLWSPVTAFVRWAYQHQAVAMSWSAGVQVAGTPWQRPTDTAALAVGQAVPHGELPATAPETVVEAYYRLGFGPHLGLSVHLQVLAHPGGDASRQPALVAGMRLLLAR